MSSIRKGADNIIRESVFGCVPNLCVCVMAAPKGETKKHTRHQSLFSFIFLLSFVAYFIPTKSFSKKKNLAVCGFLFTFRVVCSCCHFCVTGRACQTQKMWSPDTKHRRIEQNIERKKKKKRKVQTTSSENAKINIRSRDKANNSAAAVGQIRFQQLRDKILTNRYVCVCSSTSLNKCLHTQRKKERNKITVCVCVGVLWLQVNQVELIDE